MKRRLAIVAAFLATAAAAMWPAAVSIVAPNNPVTAVYTEGLDLHDGTVQQWDGTYYMYGTMYGCGFHWTQSSPWCGFGVSTASSLQGPWSQPVQLFAATDVSPFRGLTWQQICGTSAQGCFNPRMIRRDFGPSDGVHILWFNAPNDYAATGANAYYAMGCNSPTGPCGVSAGPPYGSTHKPAMYICSGNGDFSLVLDETGHPWIACTMTDQTLRIERIDQWGANGTNVGATNLAGLTWVETPGIYRHDQTWIMTFGEPNCGYCAGNATSYATAPAIQGPYTAPPNTGYSPDVRGRRAISATSCGGQPRTVFLADGQAYQWIDLWGFWNGTAANQAQAGILFVPLNYTPTTSTAGGVLAPQFEQWPCS